MFYNMIDPSQHLRKCRVSLHSTSQSSALQLVELTIWVDAYFSSFLALVCWLVGHWSFLCVFTESMAWLETCEMPGLMLEWEKMSLSYAHIMVSKVHFHATFTDSTQDIINTTNHNLTWSILMSIGNKQGAVEFLKLMFRALCLCWDRQTQDLHIDWILFRGRSLIPVLCEVVNDNIDGYYPSSHYPIHAEFMLPRTVRMIEPPNPPHEGNQ